MLSNRFHAKYRTNGKIENTSLFISACRAKFAPSFRLSLAPAHASFHAFSKIVHDHRSVTHFNYEVLIVFRQI